MQNKKDIKGYKVGQVVYLELVGDDSTKYYSEDRICKAKITKVEKRCITVTSPNNYFQEKRFRTHEFYESLLVEDTVLAPYYFLHKEKADILDKWEREKLTRSIVDKLNNRISWEKYSKDALLEISNILMNEKSNI